MADRIVINTSPLIALGKMEAVEVIAQLPFEFPSVGRLHRQINVSCWQVAAGDPFFDQPEMKLGLLKPS